MRGLSLILMLAPLGAQAQDIIGFQSPSGNIACMIALGDYAEARCDLRDLVPSFNDRPVDCDLDWGDSFSITQDDRRGELVCHGDTVMDPSSPVLPYGASARLGPFTCSSEQSGITCVNGAARGFTVSRGRQTLF